MCGEQCAVIHAAVPAAAVVATLGLALASRSLADRTPPAPPPFFLLAPRPAPSAHNFIQNLPRAVCSLLVRHVIRSALTLDQNRHLCSLKKDGRRASPPQKTTDHCVHAPPRAPPSAPSRLTVALAPRLRLLAAVSNQLVASGGGGGGFGAGGDTGSGASASFMIAYSSDGGGGASRAAPIQRDAPDAVVVEEDVPSRGQK